MRANGYDSHAADAVIRQILEEFAEIEASTYEDHLYGHNEPGFFVRDAIELNNRKGVGDDWKIHSDMDSTLHGNSRLSHPAMSNDQVLSLLKGWWSVVKWTNDQDNHAMAIAQTKMVMEYLLSKKFFITLPNGDPVESHRGPDMRASGVVAGLIANQIVPGGDYVGRGRYRVKVNLGFFGNHWVTRKISDFKYFLKDSTGLDLLEKDSINLGGRQVDIKPLLRSN